ncbi:hypothetical protein BLNAU_8544 [Blattamonas nauphoetae]|uniref:Uncharacterized protein n=1 Tax=Blattamonas nauphoetae TaxID=2049346 RepID=A0ABQ9XYB5_9EUKA|nr:hypothetical protein BLNAU_8544 [Blattamonas nauphoetae]
MAAIGSALGGTSVNHLDFHFTTLYCRHLIVLVHHLSHPLSVCLIHQSGRENPRTRTWIDESLVGLKNISKVYEPIKDIITNYEKTFALGIASYSTTFGTSLLEQLGDTKLAPILTDLTTLMDNLKDKTEREKLTSALATAISPLINKAKQLNTTWAEYAKNVTDYQTDHITFNTSYVSGLSPIVDEIISKYAEDTKTWDSPEEGEIATTKLSFGDFQPSLRVPLIEMPVL